MNIHFQVLFALLGFSFLSTEFVVILCCQAKYIHHYQCHVDGDCCQLLSVLSTVPMVKPILAVFIYNKKNER